MRFLQYEGEVFVKGPTPGADTVYKCLDRIIVQHFQDQLSKICEEQKMTEYDRVREQLTNVIMQQLMNQDTLNSMSKIVAPSLPIRVD